ncbi:hypothetical protein [Nitrososphaera viennensis]|uniref:Uncharacterized protein n=2 Tax=Nitrososphaera viennensis TaxID=1034015 RepID=A0A060HGH6_9ARCH|nr:hypothetical protein [Nitrososphaera viennensis]AIC15724.1 hypothetical protein NVIE_014830 [Nitrososphaera viennensis EN76]UVS70597.1 hypothetical protein NWT39_07365 [Nitrososphaera viennensis]
MLSGETEKNNSIISDEKLPPPSLFMDTRLPYNMENVVPMLLRIMVAKGMLSLNDAKHIMKSGESYLH